MTGRPPLPPFTAESAAQKARAAEDAWNSRDPDRVALAYTEDSGWRNRVEFFAGRVAIADFLRRKWARELDYRFIKDVWAWGGNRIAVRFVYEWRDHGGQWFRSHGNENWEFDAAGLMARRHASINDRGSATSACNGGGGGMDQHNHQDHRHDHAGHAEHSHGPAPEERGFALGVSLNLGFVVLEVAAGLAAGSMALLADAGHNLSDVLGLVLAWVAVRLARRLPGGRRTYGWHRGTILAALGNAMLLLVAVGAIVLESVQRLWEPAPVATGFMLWIAAAGIVVNGGTAMLFAAGRAGDINRRGAYLHMLADAGVSAGVVAGALLIRATGWDWVDPVLGLVIAGVILTGTWGLLRESMDLAMDVVPAGIDPGAVAAWLAARPGVAEVHDLHIWAISTTQTALTAHLVRPGAAVDDGFLADLCQGLGARFGIGHATVQVEAGDPAHPCRLAPAEVI